MNDVIETAGMVLFAAPVGEYDKRLVLLTTGLGRVTVFANGARRQGNAWQAATQPFASGTFRLYPGRNAYTLRGAQIKEYFMPLRADLEAAAYASYFAELASYYTRENLEAKNVLNLLYLAVEALLRPEADKQTVRLLFELRMFAEAGEFPDVTACAVCGKELSGSAYFLGPGRGFACPDCGAGKDGGALLDAAVMTVLRAAVTGKLSVLFRLPVTEPVKDGLRTVARRMRRLLNEREFKSLPVLEALTDSP